jgi:arylsulfatase A-like enzyme
MHLPRSIFILLFALLLAGVAQSATKPNVIFFAVDDMNDWSEPMGSAMAHTPNLDRLAKRGVTFTNAHTAGVYCAPSRTAIFTGRYASTTGCYSDEIYTYDHPEYRPLQVAFKEVGYKVYGTGKLFHHPEGGVDQRGWDEFYLRTQTQRESGWPLDSWEHGAPRPDPYPHSKFNQINPDYSGSSFMEVGPIPNDREDEMADSIRTKWATDIIRQSHDQPFFVGLGLYAPHYPNYAPQRFFDLYPLESIRRPAYKDNDLDDLPAIVRKNFQNRKIRIHDQLDELGEVEKMLQGYLAAISYADFQLGRVLDALEQSRNAQNTIIVFWSDHGYAQGQKGNWGKHTLWERTSNVPFLWAGPGIAAGQASTYTSTLIDMYPTLVELCGLTADPGHDGESLVSILAQPNTRAERTVMLPDDTRGSYAMINRDWRYIHYHDDSEELYDLNQDINEWDNLAADPAYAAIKAKMKAQAPALFAPAGTPKKQLKLELKGESFRWVPKQK